jgi:hypothetical protein
VPVRTRIASIIAALALAMGITFVAASPAHAAWEGCPTGARVCTYINANGGTPVYYYTGPIGTCIDIGYPYDEEISSVWNRFTFHKVYFYMWSDSCTGLSVVVDPLPPNGNKKNYGNDMYANDSFNSLKIVPN